MHGFYHALTAKGEAGLEQSVRQFKRRHLGPKKGIVQWKGTICPDSSGGGHVGRARAAGDGSSDGIAPGIETIR